MGLSGIAITDHEALCAHMEVNEIAKEYKEKYPNFTIALGNEIYLTDTREKNQKYFHFILIAKNEIGYNILKELSSIAWYNMYEDRRMERVPTLKTELTQIINKYGKGNIIATTACAGGELSTLVLAYHKEENLEEKNKIAKKIDDFILWCKEQFGEDFFIECAPSSQNEQIIINRGLLELSKMYKIPITTATDAHYLNKEDRWVHKSYLNSKGGEREVDSFYEFTYLMSAEECRNNLLYSFDNDTINLIFANSNDLKDRIKYFDLEKHQSIPEVEVTDYKKGSVLFDWADKYPTLHSLIWSDNIQERYWVNQCIEALQKKDLFYDERYLIRLEEEARVKRVIGEKLQTCMFAYPNTLQHYIDLFWRCGSTVGAGRGSSCAALNHWLMGIT